RAGLEIRHAETRRGVETAQRVVRIRFVADERRLPRRIPQTREPIAALGEWRKRQGLKKIAGAAERARAIVLIAGRRKQSNGPGVQLHGIGLLADARRSRVESERRRERPLRI